MKKKDSNPVDKKKKSGNPPNEKLEEKPKDRKVISKVITSEKPIIPVLNFKQIKEKNYNLTELAKTERLYKVRLLEDKQGKKDKKPRSFFPFS